MKFLHICKVYKNKISLHRELLVVCRLITSISYSYRDKLHKMIILLVEQELLTLPEHLSSPPVFSGVRVTRSLVLNVCFVDRCLSFCTFSFGHCVVCSPSIYGFWLSLWYLQTLLMGYWWTIKIMILFRKGD